MRSEGLAFRRSRPRRRSGQDQWMLPKLSPVDLLWNVLIIPPCVIGTSVEPAPGPELQLRPLQ